MIDQIIVAMGLKDAKPARVSVPKTALGQDKDDIVFAGDFNYNSVIGIIMYLSNNTRPDIASTINQCAKHTHQLTELHARHLKLIGRYLLATHDKGMILQPMQDMALMMDCYVDADFAGL